MSQREQVAFVTANGLMFAHPLMHIGKAGLNSKRMDYKNKALALTKLRVP